MCAHVSYRDGGPHHLSMLPDPPGGRRGGGGGVGVGVGVRVVDVRRRRGGGRGGVVPRRRGGGPVESGRSGRWRRGGRGRGWSRGPDVKRTRAVGLERYYVTRMTLVLSFWPRDVSAELETLGWRTATSAYAPTSLRAAAGASVGCCGGGRTGVWETRAETSVAGPRETRKSERIRGQRGETGESNTGGHEWRDWRHWNVRGPDFDGETRER